MAATSTAVAMSKQHPGPSNAANTQVQEFIVRIPKAKQKKFNIMRFSHSLKVDVTKWTQAKMERENNLKEFKAEEDQPKFGAGSEFGREQREESRRKKYGIVSKKYNPDEQPWLLKLGGKGGKKFKGIREGGVTENASYYVFTQAADGLFEAYPVEEWYNFTPIQCYKSLNAEEAEEEFGRRDKVLNLFSIMVRKRLQKETADDDDEDGEKKGTKKKTKKEQKEFKITDIDDWARDSSDSEKDDDDEEGGETKKPIKKKTKGKDKKKDKSDDEGVEESDEGDFDDREVDYMTGSSSSGEDLEDEKANEQMKGVEDEEALRKLDQSEDEEEEEENKETEENLEKEKTPEQNQKEKPKKKKEDSSESSSSDSSDSDFDDTKIQTAVFMQKATKKNGSDNSAGSSRANTPTRLNADGNKDGLMKSSQKRKLADASSSSAKKSKMDSYSGASSSNFDGINEESLRRYLSRKPMTASELLHKFKSKKTKMSPDKLVTKIADVLKKMDLVKHNVKGKMYLSLKS